MKAGTPRKEFHLIKLIFASNGMGTCPARRPSLSGRTGNSLGSSTSVHGARRLAALVRNSSRPTEKAPFSGAPKVTGVSPILQRDGAFFCSQ